MNAEKLFETIKVRDSVTIITPHGSRLKGRAVMPSSGGGWVLNLGGRHGTPGIATPENIAKVRRTEVKR